MVISVFICIDLNIIQTSPPCLSKKNRVRLTTRVYGMHTATVSKRICHLRIKMWTYNLKYYHTTLAETNVPHSEELLLGKNFGKCRQIVTCEIFVRYFFHFYLKFQDSALTRWKRIKLQCNRKSGFLFLSLPWSIFLKLSTMDNLPTNHHTNNTWIHPHPTIYSGKFSLVNIFV